jgi:hypothetical protein
MKGHAETGGDCGDKDEMTRKKRDVCKDQFERTGRKLEVPELRIKGQADRA